MKGRGEENFLKNVVHKHNISRTGNNRKRLLLTQEVTDLILKTARRPELPCLSEINDGYMVFKLSGAIPRNLSLGVNKACDNQPRSKRKQINHVVWKQDSRVGKLALTFGFLSLDGLSKKLGGNELFLE